MLVPTIITAVIALVLLYISYQRGGGQYIQGLKIAGDLLIQVLPLLIFAFLIAGLAQVLLPQELISKWIGTESGLRGILVGTLMGSFTPAGPFVSMPIAAGLLRTGASIGTMVAFITAWSLLALARLPMELGMLGWKFMLIRLACVIFFPPLAGLIANTFFSHVKVV